MMKQMNSGSAFVAAPQATSLVSCINSAARSTLPALAPTIAIDHSVSCFMHCNMRICSSPLNAAHGTRESSVRQCAVTPGCRSHSPGGTRRAGTSYLASDASSGASDDDDGGVLSMLLVVASLY
jgi:hypothetical protein